MDTFLAALALTYRTRWMVALSFLAACAMFLLLAWSGQLLHHYPSGWEYEAGTSQNVTLVALAALFGLLAAVQVAVVRKAQGSASAVSGVAGGITSLLSLTCCAPFIIPSLLSYAGFSGTAILSFNGEMHRIATPLTLLSFALVLCSLALASRSLVADCQLPAPGPVRERAQGRSG